RAKSQRLAPPAFGVEAEEEPQADTRYEGDGCRIIVHAGKTDFRQPVETLVVTEVEFKSDVPLTQEDDPGELFQLAKRIHRANANEEREYDLGEFLHEMPGDGRIGGLDGAYGCPQPVAQQRDHNPARPAEVPAAKPV